MRFSRPRFAALAILIAALSYSACSDSNEPDGDTLIRVTNGTSSTIFKVFYSPCSQATWGNNRLDDDETIAPGASRSFGVDPDCWDIAVDFALDNPVGAHDEELRNQDISDGETLVWTVPGP